MNEFLCITQTQKLCFSIMKKLVDTWGTEGHWMCHPLLLIPPPSKHAKAVSMDFLSTCTNISYQPVFLHL